MEGQNEPKTIELTQREGETSKEYERRAWRELAKHPHGTVVGTTYEFDLLGTGQAKENSTASSSTKSRTDDI